MRDARLIINARHQIATVAGSVAHLSAGLARALAWQPEPKQDAAFVADLEASLKILNGLQRQLHEAIHAVRIATRDE